LEKLNLKIRWL